MTRFGLADGEAMLILLGAALASRGFDFGREFALAYEDGEGLDPWLQVRLRSRLDVLEDPYFSLAHRHFDWLLWLAREDFYARRADD